MSKVYVINDLNHNFDKATRYGEIKYATVGKVPIFKTDVAKNMLRKGLEGFDIREDYLLISGPSLLCIMAAFIVTENTSKPLQTLVFDAKEQDYVVRHITI